MTLEHIFRQIHLVLSLDKKVLAVDETMIIIVLMPDNKVACPVGLWIFAESCKAIKHRELLKKLPQKPEPCRNAMRQQSISPSHSKHNYKVLTKDTLDQIIELLTEIQAIHIFLLQRQGKSHHIARLLP